MRPLPELRQPYGPGWEDPDWTPQVHAAEPEPLVQANREEEQPAIRSFGQFMAVVQRFAQKDRREGRLAGQTRRWIMAGGAGLLALVALPATSQASPRAAGPAPQQPAPEPAAGKESPER